MGQCSYILVLSNGRDDSCCCRTTPECGFSYKLLTILNETKADYETVNVLDEEYNADIRDVIKQYR